MCVCVHVRAGGNTGGGEERHRQAERANGMRVSRREKAGKAWFRGRLRMKTCNFPYSPWFVGKTVRNAQPAEHT